MARRAEGSGPGIVPKRRPPKNKSPLYTRPKPQSDTLKAKSNRARVKGNAAARAAKRRRDARTDAIISNKPDVAEKLGVNRPLTNPSRVARTTGPGTTAKSQPKGTTTSSSQSGRVPTTTGTSRASSSPVVGGNGSRPAGTTGSTSGGTGPVGTRNAKGKKGKKGKGKNTSSSSSTSTTATTPETGDDFVTTMFNSARRELNRQQSMADAQRLQKLEDQKAFDTWVQGQRGTTATALASEFARTEAAAQSARAQSLAAIQQYANNAQLQSGGQAGFLDAAGADANAAAYGFQQGAVDSMSAGGAFTQASLAQRNAAMSEADRARAANLMAGYNADYRGATEGINKQRSQLSMEEIKARQENRDAERQFQLDSKAAEFLQGLKQGELEVKQYQAQTDRLKVKTTADIARAANQYKAQGLSLQEARLKFDQALAGEQLTQKEKDRKTKIFIAKMKSGGGGTKGGNKGRQDAVKFITGWNTDNLKTQALPSAPRGNEGIAYARSAVSALRGFNPGLRAEAALSILSGFLPGDVVQDPRIWNAIRDSFK